MNVGEGIIPAGLETGAVERPEHGRPENVGPYLALHELRQETFFRDQIRHRDMRNAYQPARDLVREGARPIDHDRGGVQVLNGCCWAILRRVGQTSLAVEPPVDADPCPAGPRDAYSAS